ncbi:phage baseplate assembly protein V [Paenibacillus sp. 481]|nr:phage baseplate assembly protein V [Paenibacillus sp. 481]
MVAIVTNNKDPENLGRVKLKLPLRESENETDWTRIATLMAGSDRGSYFVPEVGDEVLVAFHLGEIRQPYVIGMLWSSTQPAPKANEDNNLRKIRSRAGHEITFDDDTSAGKIIINTAKGQIIQCDDQAETIKIADANGTNSIQIQGGSSGQITVKSQSSTLTLNAKGEITISGTNSVSIKALEVAVEASAALKLKGSASLNIESDGIVNIKGSLVKFN